MAKRTLQALADLIEDRVDKSRDDVTFNTFVEDMLNLTLQEIISEIPQARWLLEEHSITLTADQQFVTLPSDMDLEGIRTLRDDTNNRQVTRVDPDDGDRIDPGRDLTGTVLIWWFQRIAGVDRMYFLPRPAEGDALTMISGELITDPTSAQTTVLPAKYESWWIEGAMAKLSPRIDVNVELHRALFDRGLVIMKKDSNTNPGSKVVMASHRRRLGSTGVDGARFPSNFDVLPG